MWLSSDQLRSYSDLNRSDLMVWDGRYDAWCSRWKVWRMQFYASLPDSSFMNNSLGDIREDGLWKTMSLLEQDGHFMAAFLRAYKILVVNFYNKGPKWIPPLVSMWFPFTWRPCDLSWPLVCQQSWCNQKIVPGLCLLSWNTAFPAFLASAVHSWATSYVQLCTWAQVKLVKEPRGQPTELWHFNCFFKSLSSVAKDNQYALLFMSVSPECTILPGIFLPLMYFCWHKLYLPDNNPVR